MVSESVSVPPSPLRALFDEDELDWLSSPSRAINKNLKMITSRANKTLPKKTTSTCVNGQEIFDGALRFKQPYQNSELRDSPRKIVCETPRRPRHMDLCFDFVVSVAKLNLMLDLFMERATRVVRRTPNLYETSKTLTKRGLSYSSQNS